MSTSFQHLVSVITPNFNGLRFIARAVECVEYQNYPLEHIVVDDCSTDGSWDLLLALADKHTWLKPFRLERNSGPAVARNKAIELAQGRFLAFLDVDDFWLPHKLRTQVQFMIDSNCTLSFSDYRFVTECGRYIGRRLEGFDRIGRHLHHMTRYLGCLTIVLDRSKLPNFCFPDLAPYYRAEDFLAWLRCIQETGPAFRCPHDLARYSVVLNSRSSSASRAAGSVWELYRSVEKINIPFATIYFLAYACSVVWKRQRYKPSLQRDAVDNEFEWSLLRN